jgi:hypothetical protein
MSMDWLRLWDEHDLLPRDEIKMNVPHDHHKMPHVSLGQSGQSRLEVGAGRPQ